MKLDEIKPIELDQPISGINMSKLINIKDTGHTAENMKIFQYEVKDESDIEAFALKNEDELINIIIFRRFNINGEIFHQVQRIWTNEKYRRQGYAFALYSSLYKRLKLKIVSDLEQGPAAIELWKKLASKFPVKVLNTKTSERKKIDEVPADEIYNSTEDDVTNLLILEYKEPSSPFLKESYGGALLDRIYFTHESFHGFYD